MPQDKSAWATRDALVVDENEEGWLRPNHEVFFDKAGHPDYPIRVALNRVGQYYVYLTQHPGRDDHCWPPDYNLDRTGLIKPQKVDNDTGD
jgi:hypothetical protein